MSADCLRGIERRQLTSPTLAWVTSGLNLWSARPTCTVCVCAGAELVELGRLDVLDEAFELDVTDGPLLFVLSCARHTAIRREERRSRRSHASDLDVDVFILKVVRLV